MRLHKLVFMLKTYIDDFVFAKQLIATFNLYNKDMIPLYIILPSKSKNMFVNFIEENLNDNIFILKEEEICPYLVNERINGIKPGYINQEIIKLSFWEMHLCENYFCLDSDAIFIRDFYIKDFMYDSDTPYTVLFEDNDLKTDPFYYEKFWIEREKSIRKIQMYMGLENKKLMTCHGFQVFSSKVLKEMKNSFMLDLGLNYEDLMKISPYEFSWYNLYLQREKTIPIQPCGEIMKCFHMRHQCTIAHFQNIKIEDLARAYVGIVINSNYLKGELISWGDINKIIDRKQLRFLVKSSLRLVIKKYFHNINYY